MTAHRQQAHRVDQIFRVAIFAGLLLSLLTAPGLAKKKEKNKELLKAVKTVLVQGSNLTAMYVRRNLEQSTCLKEAAVEDQADAYLDVQEDTTRPCFMSTGRFCLGIRAQLIDRKTDKTLWFRTDDDMGSRLNAGGAQTAGKWVLWQLNDSVCKGR